MKEIKASTKLFVITFALIAIGLLSKTDGILVMAALTLICGLTAMLFEI